MRRIIEIDVTFRSDDGISDTFVLNSSGSELLKFAINDGEPNEVDLRVIAAEPPVMALEVSGSLARFRRNLPNRSGQEQ